MSSFEINKVDLGDSTWPCICTSLGTWWKMRRCLLTEAGGEESAEGGTSLNKVFQGLGAKCSEGQWFAVGQRPWGLPGRRGSLAARTHAPGRPGTAPARPSGTFLRMGNGQSWAGVLSHRPGEGSRGQTQA